MSSFTLPPAPAGPPLTLIDPANQAAVAGGRPVVPGAAARWLYLLQLVVPLALCLIGLTINLNGWRAVTALQAAGAPIGASIVDIDSYKLLGRYSRLYFITFEYQAPGPGGAPQAFRSTDITFGDSRERGRFFLGKELAVRYLPADPAVARFSDSAPPTLWLVLFALASGALLCALLFFASLCWGDATLRRRGRVLPGTVERISHSIWPRSRKVAYRFTAPDGRALRGHADIDVRRLGQAGEPQPGAPVAVLFVDEGLHTML